MEIRLLAIGRPMPDWIASGWNEYARRLPRHIRLELIELVAPARSQDPHETRRREGQALLARCRSPGYTVALDEHGRQWSTQDLASRLEHWQMMGESVNLCIGGASGHCPELLARSDVRWSLGALTFPHMLVRVIVGEQLYRAWTLLSGHPYHRS
ncbi:MAG: 23S rRNA (pseudouridine(1915)-N(3))-methyltransferase RlmH [Wenzhouxiangellaceae bacterium]|nr:23S rRNA (pseudouridine(1915)-N(3))-methyltransferase RlmH [Wenzhouxiangellaceae bacterium]